MPNALVSASGLRLLVWFLMVVPAWGCVASAAELAASASYKFAVLVFTRTAGFRHDSIPAGIESIASLGKDHGFAVVNAEDAAVFTDENLAKYRVIIFLNTTGHILDVDQQAAFERFVRIGGGRKCASRSFPLVLSGSMA